MRDKNIVVGICGGIAAYKAISLCSLLTKAGARVHVILTHGASQFVTPLTLQSITRQTVHTDVFHEPDPSVIGHIHLADTADLVVIAPATANVIAKAAMGMADDLLTTVLLATRAPVLFAPAMNVHMLEHAAVRDNIGRLRKLGYVVAEPGEGPLACGYTGKGRLPEPEELYGIIEAMLSPKRDLDGLRVLVTAGGTHEPVDPVRFIGNRASGKMGFALAEAAAARGGNVTLVAGPSSAPLPLGVKQCVRVKTALEMREAVLSLLPESDVVVKAAAVADFRPEKVEPQKVKKRGFDEWELRLVKNPDILAEVGQRKRADQVVVGFAAETEHLLENAMEKLNRKNADMIVANDVSAVDAGFEQDDNRVTLLLRGRDPIALPLMPKRSVADAVWDEIAILSVEKKRHAT